MRLIRATFGRALVTKPRCSIFAALLSLHGPSLTFVSFCCLLFAFFFFFFRSAGGIVLSSRGGQIVCRNTLDSRLDIAFAALKPQVRGTLFGFRAKIVDHVVEKKGGVSRPK